MKYGEVIIGLKIDMYGDVDRRGALHWVVVKTVQPDGRDDGYVTIYNPSPNRDQTLKWKEFSKSAGVPAGVFVIREDERSHQSNDK